MKKLFIVDLDNTLANTTRDLKGDPARLPHLTLAPGVREFLESHGKETVLLSAGVNEFQKKKLAVLNIEKAFREVVFVLLPQEKTETEIFAQLIKKHKVLPTAAIVIGDRIDQEIKAGNSIGATTVRVCLPEGKYNKLEPVSPEEAPNHTVKDFFELMKLPIF
jgi:FMN phosphatase YigB (HAD superfamily)